MTGTVGWLKAVGGSDREGEKEEGGWDGVMQGLCSRCNDFGFTLREMGAPGEA